MRNPQSFRETMSGFPMVHVSFLELLLELPGHDLPTPISVGLPRGASSPIPHEERYIVSRYDPVIFVSIRGQIHTDQINHPWDLRI